MKSSDLIEADEAISKNDDDFADFGVSFSEDEEVMKAVELGKEEMARENWMRALIGRI